MNDYKAKKLSIKHVILAFIAILLLVVFFYIRSNGDKVLSSNSSSIKTDEALQSGITLGSNVVSGRTNQFQEAGVANNENFKYVQNLLDWYKSNNAQIEFYGKIVDQNMRGISGAQIRVRISMFDSSSAGKMVKPNKSQDPLDYKSLILTSDADGLFSINGIDGQILYIEAIEKTGLVISGRQLRRFCYGNHTGSKHIPDKDKPVIFAGWEKHGAETLIKNSASAELPPDGKKICLSLLNENSRKCPSIVDDLSFQLWIDTNSFSSPSWSLVVEAIAGGLVETTNNYLYSAPKDGYLKQIRWNYNSNMHDYSLRTTKKIYVKSRGERLFAGVELEIDCRPQSGGYVFLENLINPNGSRNLEYDPVKAVRHDDYLKIVKELDRLEEGVASPH